MNSLKNSANSYKTRRDSPIRTLGHWKWKSRIFFKTIGIRVQKTKDTLKPSNTNKRSTTSFIKSASIWKRTWVAPRSTWRSCSKKNRTTLQKSRLWRDTLIILLTSWSKPTKQWKTSKIRGIISRLKSVTFNATPTTSSKITRTCKDCVLSWSKTRCTFSNKSMMWD